VCVARAAERHGGARVDAAAGNYWLAAAESTLDERERLLRVLIRSCCGPDGTPWHGCPEVFTRPADLWLLAAQRVAECRKENRRVGCLSPHSVHRIGRDRVLSHFARLRGVGDARDAVLAAARDRGITSLDQLHTHGRELLPFVDGRTPDLARP
jgi:hypothetical protein